MSKSISRRIFLQTGALALGTVAAYRKEMKMGNDRYQLITL